MHDRILWLAATLVLSAGSSAWSQVVQLPTFHQFSVSTTVSVPDGGAAYLGGVSRGAWSSNSRGVPGLSNLPFAGRLFRNRGIGSRVGASSVGVTATIIDHAELDRMVLAEAAARRGEAAGRSEIDRKAAYLSQFVARRETAPLAMRADETPADTVGLRRAVEDATRQRETDMAACLARGEEALAQGHVGAARCAYNTVARRGTPAQQQAAQVRLAALEVREKLPRSP